MTPGGRRGGRTRGRRSTPRVVGGASVDALLAAAASNPDDAEAVGRLLTALLDSEVYWPVLTSDDGAERPLPMTHEGRTVVPFFSEQDVARRAVAGVTGVSVTVRTIECRRLMAMAVANDVDTVLNPGNRFGKEFTRAEMSDLLSGVAPRARTRTVQAATTLLVGEPAHVPPELKPALAGTLDALGGVQSATLAWARYPDGLMGYLLQVVTSRPREDVAAAIGALELPTDGRTLDVVVQPPGSGGGIKADVAPFYPSP